MKMKKVKFAVVGCGHIGKRHAEHIFKNPKAELVCVCDILKNAADELAKKYNAKAYYNFSDMLKQDFDVLSICTPSGFHASMCIEGFKAKKHILCEKPMAINLQEADEIVKAENKSGKKFFMVKQNRYNSPIKALKDAIYNKQMGDIVLVNCNVLWNRRKEYYEQADWRGTMELDGGALMTQCSHFLDLMIWMGGPVKSVFAKMVNLSHPYIETEDCGFITIIFKSGAIGSLQYTTCVYNHNLEGSMTVLGTKGSIKVGGLYINELELWDVTGVEKPILPQSAPPNDYGTYKGSMSNHDKVIENVIQVLTNGADITTNSMQGKESIEVMQAAYISAYENRQVELPLKGKDYSFKLNKQKPLSGHKKTKR